MAGEQERDQLVAQLVVAHRLPVLEPRRDEHREDVVTLAEVRVGAPLGDLRTQQLVDRAALPPQALDRVLATEPAGEHDLQLQPR